MHGTGTVLREPSSPGFNSGILRHSFWTSSSRKKFWFKIYLVFDADPGSGIFLTLDPGSGMEKKFGSGINIPDPQHWLSTAETTDSSTRSYICIFSLFSEQLQATKTPPTPVILGVLGVFRQMLPHCRRLPMEAAEGGPGTSVETTKMFFFFSWIFAEEAELDHLRTVTVTVPYVL